MSALFQSTLLQMMLNYFDEKDDRVRERTDTLSAQLLNSAAISLENSAAKVKRESDALFLSTTPLNIDARGVYQQVIIPLTYSFGTDESGKALPPSVIQGTLPNSTVVTVGPYDDALPVPTRVEVDSSIGPVPLSNPVLFDVTGDGTPKSYGSATLNPPNKLTFWLSGLGAALPVLQVQIIGEPYPAAAWPQDVAERSEYLTANDEGVFTSDVIYSSIKSITITNLPAGAELKCWTMPFGLPGEPDPARPYVDSQWRGLLIDRYWQIEDLLVKEMGFRTHFSGFEHIDSYLSSVNMKDLAVEPNTAGLWLTDGSKLYYASRRQPLPSNQDETGLTVEPPWGIKLGYSLDNPGNVRWLQVEFVPYGNANNVTMYRTIIQDPAGETYVYTESGLVLYAGSVGWRRAIADLTANEANPANQRIYPGVPNSISFPMTQTGTYIVTLELVDINGNQTQDVSIWNNAALLPLVVIDLSGTISGIKGICFDGLQRLWAWTGTYAIPLKIHYDAYLFDASTRSLYLTDKYSSIEIGN